MRLRRLMQRAESGALQRAETGSANKRETISWVGAFHTDRIRKSSFTVVASFYPTLYGEKILLKLTTLKSVRSLDQLGMTAEDSKLMQRLLARTEGLLLIMGPPDHGKTTTLYSLLKHYEQAGTNVLMIESPIELVMPGVNQVSGHIGCSYHAWQSFVRYTHPDVLAISDLETDLMLRLAFECAPTTQVLASYTAGNALAGFRTLAESMNAAFSFHLPSFLPILLELLNGMIVQRLVRTLCPNCKEEIPEDERNHTVLQHLGIAVDAPLYHAKGCQECMETGYQGQIGMFEIVRCEKHIIEALQQHPPISSEHWNRLIAELSVHTLQQQGAQFVREGISSPQEVWRTLSA
jgi:type II secretory ATPase GspE/PulE/Tfp pilus assembly ATPase PilB-like protein